MTIEERNRIALENKNLVWYVIRKEFHRVTVMTEDEMFSAGFEGLLRAVELYDESKGTLATYSVFWIREKIRKELESQRLIYLPENVKMLKNRIMRQYQSSNDEWNTVLARFGLTQDEWEIINPKITDLDRVYFDTDSKRRVTMTDEHVIDNAEISSLRAILDKELEKLPPREKDVLIARFGLSDGNPQTLEDLAKTYGCSRERIRQMEAKALRRLRKRKKLQEFQL